MSIGAKRIVLTATSDLTHDRRLIRICTSLQAAGYDVLLVGRKEAGSVPLSPRPYRQKRIRCIFNKSALFYIEFNKRLLLRLIFTRADIIVASDLDTILAVAIASRIKGARLVYDAHEYFTELPELEGRSLVKKIWDLLARKCIPRATLCYTVSDSIAGELGKRYRKEFHTIINAPELSENKPAVTEQPRPVLIYQGALNQGRGLEEYVRGMHDIDGILKIAGDGPLKKSLEALTLKEGLQHKVLFTGKLDRDELSQLTANATIGLNLLSSKSLSYYYSLSNKFFDYIHADLPQVCIDFPEYRAINERFEVAVLCENSVEELVKAVNLLLSDHVLYDTLRRNCAGAAAALNWQTEKTKLLSLYDRL